MVINDAKLKSILNKAYSPAMALREEGMPVDELRLLYDKGADPKRYFNGNDFDI